MKEKAKYLVNFMKKIYRSRYDKKISGICGGLGHYFKIDPVVIRLLVIFLCILTAFIPVLIAYILAAFIIPLEPLNAPALEFRRFYRSKNNKVIAGICGGLAHLLKIDPTILRLLFIVITLITGFVPMLVAYIIGIIIIPQRRT